MKKQISTSDIKKLVILKNKYYKIRLNNILLKKAILQCLK